MHTFNFVIRTLISKQPFVDNYVHEMLDKTYTCNKNMSISTKK